MRMELPPNPSQLFVPLLCTHRYSQLTKHYCIGWVGKPGRLGYAVFVPWEEGMGFSSLGVVSI